MKFRLLSTILILLCMLTSCQVGFHNAKSYQHRDYVRLNPPPKEVKLGSTEGINNNLDNACLKNEDVERNSEGVDEEPQGDLLDHPTSKGNYNTSVLNWKKLTDHKDRSDEKNELDHAKPKETKATAALNIVSFVAGLLDMLMVLLGIIFLLAGLGLTSLTFYGLLFLFIGVGLSFVALILGIIGVAMDHPSKKLGWVGIILGGSFLIIGIFAIILFYVLQ